MRVYGGLGQCFVPVIVGMDSWTQFYNNLFRACCICGSNQVSGGGDEVEGGFLPIKSLAFRWKDWRDLLIKQYKTIYNQNWIVLYRV